MKRQPKKWIFDKPQGYTKKALRKWLRLFIKRSTKKTVRGHGAAGEQG